ncbi:MAG: hypothetical protein ACT4QB_11400 [Gammaproteobacteria bacterium]
MKHAKTLGFSAVEISDGTIPMPAFRRRNIIHCSTRAAPGGAAPEAINAMIAQCEQTLTETDAWTSQHRRRLRKAEDALLQTARARSPGSDASSPASA